jgi:hypothetical protein
MRKPNLHSVRHALAPWVIPILALVLTLMLSACGGGGDGGEPGPGPGPSPEVATFAFRIEGRGAEEEFRIATSSPEFIAQARAQLSLPVVGRKLFPNGRIAAGDGGVNLGWGWHFTDATLVEAAIEVCDGSPSLVQADLPNWLRTVQRFCPWGGYVHAEVTGHYPLAQFAIGQTREIAQEAIRVQLLDIVDSRCPAAAICVSAGHAEAVLSVKVGSREPQTITVAGLGDLDRPVDLHGYRFTIDKLDPYPVNDPLPKDQYRATITVREL